MRRWKEKLSKIKMPHTYVILTIILLVVVALCYLIPAGEYVRELDPVSGKTVVIPDSFHFTEGKKPGLFDIFLSLQRGYVDAADILFLIVFAYGYVYILKWDTERRDPCIDPKNEGKDPSADPGVHAAFRSAWIYPGDL